MSTCPWRMNIESVAGTGKDARLVQGSRQRLAIAQVAGRHAIDTRLDGYPRPYILQAGQPFLKGVGFEYLEHVLTLVNSRAPVN